MSTKQAAKSSKAQEKLKELGAALKTATKELDRAAKAAGKAQAAYDKQAAKLAPKEEAPKEEAQQEFVAPQEGD